MARKAQWTKPINLLITEEMHSRIKEITNRKEISMAVWIRAAIKAKLQQEDCTNDKQR